MARYLDIEWFIKLYQTIDKMLIYNAHNKMLPPNTHGQSSPSTLSAAVHPAMPLICFPNLYKPLSPLKITKNRTSMKQHTKTWIHESTLRPIPEAKMNVKQPVLRRRGSQYKRQGRYNVIDRIRKRRYSEWDIDRKKPRGNDFCERRYQIEC